MPSPCHRYFKEKERMKESSREGLFILDLLYRYFY
jgi:hypothetical protein